jgi:hypothetical protein
MRLPVKVNISHPVFLPVFLPSLPAVGMSPSPDTAGL